MLSKKQLDDAEKCCNMNCVDCSNNCYSHGNDMASCAGEVAKTALAYRELLERAKYIMDFHADRCPIRPKTNYSGCEEHLAEYRKVMRDIEKLLKE